MHWTHPLTITLSLLASAQDPAWLARQPAFGRSKPLIRTQDRWEAERGNIWIGVSFFYQENDNLPIKYCGSTPGIAGSSETQKLHTTEGNSNQVVEYVTRTGETLWIPASGSHGISSAIVPLCESARKIRLFDKEGRILGNFRADPKAVPPRWEPFISGEGQLMFERTTGGEKDTWENDHTIRPFARLSGDQGRTWAPFKGIATATPTVPIPEDLKAKEQLVVEVFGSKDMTIEVRRFLLGTHPGSRGVFIGNYSPKEPRPVPNP